MGWGEATTPERSTGAGTWGAESGADTERAGVGELEPALEELHVALARKTMLFLLFGAG